MRFQRLMHFAAIAATLGTGLSMAAEARDWDIGLLVAADGWAAPGTDTGTVDGVAAFTGSVHYAINWSDSIAAPNDGVYPNASRIIEVDRAIGARMDDDRYPLACENYCRNGYLRVCIRLTVACLTTPVRRIS